VCVCVCVCVSVGMYVCVPCAVYVCAHVCTLIFLGRGSLAFIRFLKDLWPKKGKNYLCIFYDFVCTHQNKLGQNGFEKHAPFSFIVPFSYPQIQIYEIGFNCSF